MPTIEEKTNVMQKLQLMAAAEFAFKSPLIPRSYEKIRSWFESPTTNGMAIWKFEYFPVRPEALEGRSTIFSQLPLFQRENFFFMTQTPPFDELRAGFWKRGERGDLCAEGAGNNAMDLRAGMLDRYRL